MERLLREVIKRAPNLPDPYHTLGTMHEGAGDLRRALNFFMIAVHLTPKDVHLWRRLAKLSTDLGFLRQAIYCLTKVGLALCIWDAQPNTMWSQDSSTG